MFFKLTSGAQQELLLLPETGMGYQVIEAERRDKTVRTKYMVYNCELIVEYNRINEARQKFRIEGYKRVFGRTDYLPIDERTISLVSRSKITKFISFAEREEKNKGRHWHGKGACDNKKEPMVRNYLLGCLHTRTIRG